ncbi:Uncharacterized protein Adt_23622 [Abeliophyllum distichum]|uniref:Uncharacterized protein n=1 Tax=Abeliophyllum distichum TaxID=126358 RepID=A0ABD1SBE7_9LAMI
MKNLKTLVGLIATTLSGRTHGILLSNTEANPQEQVNAITVQSSVQLPEIHVKMSVAKEDNVRTTYEEQIEMSKRQLEKIQEQNSDTLHIKATIHVKAYVSPMPFP